MVSVLNDVVVVCDLHSEKVIYWKP